MLIRNWTAFALSSLLSGSAAVAQYQSTENYAWRASGSSTQRSDYNYRGNEHLIAAPQAIGNPHGQFARPSVLSASQPIGSGTRMNFRQDDQPLLDQQPSASDLRSSQQDVPPVPQGQAPIQSPDLPPLRSTQSAPLPPQGQSGSIANQPGLSVRDMGDPQPECEYIPGWCNLGCERKIFGSTPNGFAIGGWNQTGYHSAPTLGFNDRPDQWNVHQQWFYAEKRPVNCTGWGFRTDMMYGIDAQNIQAFGNPVTGAPDGWDNSWDYGSYGWALPQAYVSYQNCDTYVKMGKFFSPFGFESIASPQNFFYSRSYARNFIEPFSMTGALVERQVSDQQSILAGASAGWDTGFDQNSSGFTGIIGARTQFGDNVSLASTASLGNTGYRGEGWMNSHVLQVQLSKKVRYVLQGDMLNLGTNQEFAIVNYLFREFNPCLTAGTRLEWWKSDQIFPDTRSTWSLTNGLNFRPHANVTIRPESRMDWGAAAIDPGKLIFGVDAIITF